MLSLHQAKIIALDSNSKEDYETKKLIESLIDKELIKLFEEGQTECVLPISKRHLNRLKPGTIDVLLKLYTHLGWGLKIMDDTSSEYVTWFLVKRPVEVK